MRYEFVFEISHLQLQDKKKKKQGLFKQFKILVELAKMLKLSKVRITMNFFRGSFVGRLAMTFLRYTTPIFASNALSRAL